MSREWRNCPDTHYATCIDCGTIWHLIAIDYPLDREAWTCGNCRPPAPHCDTCTCYGGD